MYPARNLKPRLSDQPAARDDPNLHPDYGGFYDLFSKWAPRPRTPGAGRPTTCIDGKTCKPSSTNRKESIMNMLRLRGTSCLTVCAMVLLAIVAFGWTSTAEANSSEGATILNVVQVDFADASGTVTYTATASSTVTINLVEQAVTLSGAPTAGSPGDTAAAPGNQTVASGATASYVYAITGNANGEDTIDLSHTVNSATDVAAGYTVTYSTIDHDGSTVITSGDPASITLGGAVAIGAVDADTVQFPGGALSGFSVGDIVVIDGVDYEVSGVTVGSAASHDNLGAVAHSDQGTTTNEVLGTLDLIANANPNGSNTAPALAALAAGTVVAEQILVQVDVTATANNPTTDGVVVHTLNTDYNNDATDDTTISNTTTFSTVGLTIQKDVQNVTAGGGYGASGTGDPGDILEYRLTIANTSGDATDVTITDIVPDYTTLVVFSDSYDGTVSGGFSATDLFAYADDGTNTTDLTVQATDDEDTTVAAGNASAQAAGSTLTIFVGSGAADTTDTGGTVTSSDTIYVYYQVQID